MLINLKNLILLAVVLISSGCTSTQLVGNYDETIDRSTTAAWEKTEALFANLERIDQAPDYNSQFYDSVRGDLRSLKSRSELTDKNEKTTEQFVLLLESVNDLEQYNKGKYQSKRSFALEELKPLHDAFTQQFKAILRLELAKKRMKLTDENQKK